MRLNEIVSILKSTELKQIVVGEDDSLILSLLNLALIDVYAKFNILKEEQLISIVPNKTRYRLIDDSQAILKVYGRHHKDDETHELPINDMNNKESVFTPQPYVLHVPHPVIGDTLSVIQTVTPPFITTSNIDTVDLIIPPQLLEPIVNYCGYRAYLSMNGDEQTETTSHYRRYIRSCDDVLKRGLTHYTISTNLKTPHRGFPGAI